MAVGRYKVFCPIPIPRSFSLIVLRRPTETTLLLFVSAREIIQVLRNKTVFGHRKSLQLAMAYESRQGTEQRRSIRRLHQDNKIIFTDRTYRVEYDSKFSNWYPMKTEISQGSVLTPILFHIYISDTPKYPYTKIAHFAYDTASTP